MGTFMLRGRVYDRLDAPLGDIARLSPDGPAAPAADTSPRASRARLPPCRHHRAARRPTPARTCPTTRPEAQRTHSASEACPTPAHHTLHPRARHAVADAEGPA